MNREEVNMDNLMDIREIHMEENMTRKERIQYLKELANEDYVKYDNVLIHLDFKYVDDYVK